MLKKIKNQIFKRKKSQLKGTPGESIRDAIITAGIKAAEESAYVAGNNTDKLLEIGEKVVSIAESTGQVVDRGTELIGGAESAKAFASIAFKTTKDAARGDTVCTGLCVISATCESVALVCSTVKIVPFRGRIYVGAKIVSKGCMTYRNACAGEGC